MIRWSRKQEFGSAETQEFGDVPGGALVRIRDLSGTHIVYVPNVRVYDAGGGVGPFLVAINENLQGE